MPQVIDIFTRTPAERREAMLEHMIQFMRRVSESVNKGEITGDYSDLESELNRRARRK